jgi:hypothetical protein
MSVKIIVKYNLRGSCILQNNKFLPIFQKNVLLPSSEKFVWLTDRNENHSGGLSVLDQY